MKLKIVSEGTGDTTKVINVETGEEVENVVSLDFSMTAFNVDAAIVISNPDLDIKDLNTQEIIQGDAERYDGTAISPYNQ
jgi:hypothetical protein